MGSEDLEGTDEEEVIPGEHPEHEGGGFPTGFGHRGSELLESGDESSEESSHAHTEDAE